MACVGRGRLPLPLPLCLWSRLDLERWIMKPNVAAGRELIQPAWLTTTPSEMRLRSYYDLLMLVIGAALTLAVIGVLKLVGVM